MPSSLRSFHGVNVSNTTGADGAPRPSKNSTVHGPSTATVRPDASGASAARIPSVRFGRNTTNAAPDGAKSSCAAKISAAVDTGIFGYEMYRSGQQFYGGDGLVVKGVEKSIDRFARLARVGMKETDREIILMMTEEE